jgi:hypothetical protein
MVSIVLRLFTLTYLKLPLAHYPNKDSLSNFYANNWAETIDHFLEVAALSGGTEAVEETY